jgi:drug/metabolite transporter (DMT)-like permease
MTDSITGALFGIGLAYGLLRLRERRLGLLWIWLVLAMVGGIFSVRHESPQAYRTLNAVPAIALLAVYVAERFVSAVARLPGHGLQGERLAGAGKRAHAWLVTGMAALLLLLLLGGAALWEGGTNWLHCKG